MATLLIGPIDVYLPRTLAIFEYFEGDLKRLAQQLESEPVYVLDPDLPQTGYGLVGFYDEWEDNWGIMVNCFNIPIALKVEELCSAYPEADDMADRIKGIAYSAGVYPKPSTAIAWAAEWFEAHGVSPDEIPLDEWPAIEMKAPETLLEVGQYLDLLTPDPSIDTIERTLIELDALPKPQ